MRKPTPALQAMLEFCQLETEDGLYTATDNPAVDHINSELGRALSRLGDSERSLAYNLARLEDATNKMKEAITGGMMPVSMWVAQHAAAVATSSAEIQAAVTLIHTLGAIRLAVLAAPNS
jgi:hypothetical protein